MILLRVSASATEILDWLRAHARDARALQPRFKPPTITGSKLFGHPYSEGDAPWPTCGCGEPLYFVAQIAGRHLVDSGLPTSGLLQLFVCLQCVHRQDGSHYRVQRYPKPSKKRARRLEPVHPLVPKVPQHSLAAVPIVSVPAYAEAVCDASVSAWLAALPGDAWTTYAALAKEVVGRARIDGHAAGGHPQWVQEPLYPRCEQCDAMRLLVQLDQPGGPPTPFPLQWGGDSGRAFLFACEHEDRLIVQGV